MTASSFKLIIIIIIGQTDRPTYLCMYKSSGSLDLESAQIYLCDYVES